MRPANCEAPLRVDLAGGTLDVRPLDLALPGPTVTVNVALALRACARVEPAAPGDAAITLQSGDLGIDESHPDLDALAAACASRTSRLPLLAEAVLAAAPQAGLHLRTDSGCPAGAGLGGSSALLVAALRALDLAAGRTRPWTALHRFAQDVETRVLRTVTGYQDHAPAIWGGCLALEGAIGGPKMERLPVDLDALAARLRLAYTGLPHRSGITNWGVLRAWMDGEPATVDALEAIAANARAVRARLRAGDLDAALDGVVEDGALRRRMAPGVTTPSIERIDALVRERGARGTKICGAGGGGCLLVVLDAPGTGEAVEAALAEAGAHPMPLRFVAEGLSSTRARASPPP